MFEQHSFGNKLFVTRAIPQVAFTFRALQDMHIITDQCDTEVGWLCTASRLPNGDILVDEVFLPKQQCHGTTTEIDPNWIADVPPEKWDKIRAWFHSHVRMGTSPSGQDNDQLDDNLKGVDDFFIRGICNKHGRMEITLVLKDIGLKIEDCKWYVVVPEMENLEEVNAALAYLNLKAVEKDIKGYKTYVVLPIEEDRTEILKEKLKEKVSGFARQTTIVGFHNRGGHEYGGLHGNYDYGKKNGKKNKNDKKDQEDDFFDEDAFWMTPAHGLVEKSGWYKWDDEKREFYPSPKPGRTYKWEGWD